MSCIAGILNLDGAPVDRDLLERMTGAMKNRAPDASGLWCSGNVGLGHAMLRIAPESADERQPCSLDGQVWIAADARIDGRAELIAQLRSAGEPVRSEAPDPELILHAYRAWGEALLEHLIGDFAFALWDERRRQLHCACDHFGVRPFYYARTSRVFAFASDIDALLIHPAVSTNLDDAAVGDFLLLGSYQESELTIYRDVRRLPGASHICAGRDRIHIRKYWQFPAPDAVRYRDYSEYVEHFQQVFELAVNDRLRAERIALELSGGMDSASIAAVAADNAKSSGSTLTAFTRTANELLSEDQEGHYAALVASHLSIPIVLQEAGNIRLFERLGDPQLRTAEPSPAPYLAFLYDAYASMSASGARVMLSGQGGDETFSGSSAHLVELMRTWRFANLFLEILNHARHTGSLRGMGLRAALLKATGRQTCRPSDPDWLPAFPDWLDADFAARARLRDRWELAWERMLKGTDLEYYFGEMCLGLLFSRHEMFGLPLVARYPFFDLRLVEFMFGVPNFVKSGKGVLRSAMHRRLPEPVRVRSKTPAAGDFVRTALTRNMPSTPLESSLTLVANHYVEPGRYMQAFEHYMVGGEGIESTWASGFVVTPVCLNFWLSQHI